MAENLEDYLRDLGNSSTERRLAGLLRKETPDARLRFIEKLTSSSDPKVFRASFRLAKSILADNRSVVEFLRYGLGHSDVSTISHWLEVAAPRLGGQKLIHFLGKHLDSDPKSVVAARYWLKKFLPKKEQVEESINSLDREISERIKGDQSLEELLSTAK